MNRIEFMAMYRRFEGTVSEQHKIGCTTVLPRLLFHWSPTVDYGYALLRAIWPCSVRGLAATCSLVRCSAC